MSKHISKSKESERLARVARNRRKIEADLRKQSRKNVSNALNLNTGLSDALSNL